MRIELRILEHFARDHAAAGIQPIEAYLEAYPDWPDIVRREYARLTAARATEVTGPEVGRRFGRYLLQSILGRGGQGVVWLANDPLMQRPVALKLFPESGGQDGDGAPPVLARELQALVRLNHPGLVGVHEAGQVDGRPYLAMPYVRGESLATRIAEWRRAPVDLRIRLELAKKIAAAMGEAHAVGVVHRDLKPTNILIDERDQPIVIDFGLAKATLDDQVTLVLSGEWQGTPRYLAPERWQGRGHDDPRADVFALGVVFYEMVLLRPPFEGATIESIGRAIECDEPDFEVPREAVRLPKDVVAILGMALAKSSGRRYAEAHAVYVDLDAFLSDRPVVARLSTPLERLWRWTRTHVELASLLVVLSAAMAGLGIAAIHFRRSAGREREARALALASVAESEIARGRLLFRSGDAGATTESRARFESAASVRRQLSELGVSRHATGTTDYDLRTDLVAAWLRDDYRVEWEADAPGLAQPILDSSQSTIFVAEAQTSRGSARVHAVDATSGRRLESPVTTAPTGRLLAAAPNRHHFAYLIRGQVHFLPESAPLDAGRLHASLGWKAAKQAAFIGVEYAADLRHVAFVGQSEEGGFWCLASLDPLRVISARQVPRGDPVFFHFDATGSAAVAAVAAGKVEVLTLDGDIPDARVWGPGESSHSVVDARIARDTSQLRLSSLVSTREKMALVEQVSAGESGVMREWATPLRNARLLASPSGEWLAVAHAEELEVLGREEGTWIRPPRLGGNPTITVLGIDDDGALLVAIRGEPIRRWQRERGLSLFRRGEDPADVTAISPRRLRIFDRQLIWSETAAPIFAGDGLIPLSIRSQWKREAGTLALLLADDRGRLQTWLLDVRAQAQRADRVVPVPGNSARGLAVCESRGLVACWDDEVVHLARLETLEWLVSVPMQGLKPTAGAFLADGKLRLQVGAATSIDVDCPELETRLRRLGLGY